ncbi:hypothetical protein AK830_g213 [Neonectria ditissima]|uniref:Zn(2)-C6 fungal-type domain-containing protein n=1 Tax=Neonectria ditissima TaxID=78410 RepID=A0A0N8H943_9HYPO|nr:hypothetical protein AK830_g213 [Neonectria ditissima]
MDQPDQSERQVVLRPMPQRSEVRDAADDWTGVTSTAQRRKLQNRLNQRARPVALGPGHIPPTSQLPDLPHADGGQEETAPRPGCRLTARSKQLMVNKFAQQAYAEYIAGAHCLGNLPTLMEVNVFYALSRNATALGICEEWLTYDAISPFCRHGPGLNRYPMETASTAPITRPKSLQPTELQLSIPHHPWIDLFPVPRLRDNFLSAIENADTIDEDELCYDMVEISDAGEAKPSLIIWGEPWDPLRLSKPSSFERYYLSSLDPQPNSPQSARTLPAMVSAKKPKACHACTNGKRRCDKMQPVCGRCDEKDVECRYPPTKRRRHHPEQVLNPSPPLPLAATALDEVALEGLVADDVFDFEQWSQPVIDWNELGLSHTQAEDPMRVDHPGQAENTAQAAHSLPDASQELTSVDPPGPSSSAWFINPDSWMISHAPSNIPRFSSAVFVNYVRGLEAWLRQWTTHGHCPLIHRQLYADRGLPQVMRDAFASIAVHNTKTAQNESLVYQVIEANAASLLRHQDSCSSDTILDIRQHLARTQALFIHLVLGLFSPTIRPRAQAERNIPMFQTWLRQLWEAATLDPDVSGPPPGSSASKARMDAVTDALFDGDPAPRLWRTWVLAESIRRLWLLGTMTLGVYQTQKQGLSDCSGGTKLTGRGDIWAAESAVGWSRAVQKQDPLFIMSLECDVLFMSIEAAEVDEFARHLSTVMCGLERVESWVARTAGSRETVKLHY